MSTDYILRTEQGAAALKTAGEAVSDALLIAIIVKGLQQTFNTFSAFTSHVIEFADGTQCVGVFRVRVLKGKVSHN